MGLTEFERMARGLPCRRFVIVTLDLRAYVDDSETLGTYSVLAGYSAAYEDWLVFDAYWRESLRRYGLTEFKAKDLEGGNGEYAGRDNRPQILEDFVSRICEAKNLHGAAVAIDLQAYGPHKPRIQLLREPGLGSRLAADPFYLAMQYILGTLTQPYRDLSSEERVRVTFGDC